MEDPAETVISPKNSRKDTTSKVGKSFFNSGLRNFNIIRTRNQSKSKEEIERELAANYLPKNSEKINYDFESGHKGGVVVRMFREDLELTLIKKIIHESYSNLDLYKHYLESISNDKKSSKF